MSVSRECAFAEYKPNVWYLLLASDEYGDLSDYNAEAWGPFKSQKATDKYLSDYFANPGALWVHEYDGKFSKIEERLISKATRPNVRYSWD